MSDRPLRVALITMPFGALSVSLALTKLKAVVRARLGARVDLRNLYLVYDMARMIGRQRYDELVYWDPAVVEWLFRDTAFPGLEDTLAKCLAACPHGADGAEPQQIRELAASMPPVLEELISRYDLENCDVVGFTSMERQRMASLALARLLKRRRPDILTLLGGPDCCSPMGTVIARNVPYIDFVFSGPATITLPLLLEHVVEDRLEECHDIRGVFSRIKLERAGHTSVSETGCDLDINTDLQLKYDDYFESFERTFPGEQMNWPLVFETSRGCWWGERCQCAFCAYFYQDHKYQPMRPDRAAQEFQRLLSYWPRASRFGTVDAMVPPDYPRTVFPQLRVPKGARIFYEVRPTLDYPELRTMVSAGVREMKAGIEALSTVSLKLMRKGTTAFQNIRFLKDCVRCRLPLGWNLLLGAPSEPEGVYEKYLQDIPRCQHLPPPNYPQIIKLVRYSPYFREAQHFGIQPVPDPCYEALYPFDATALADLAFYFQDGNLSALRKEHLLSWQRRLRKVVHEWRVRWFRPPRRVPRLGVHRQDDRWILFDSRGPEERSTEISEAAVQLLCLLELPHLPNELAAKLPDLAPTVVAAEFDQLRLRNLLFEESGRAMSLVVLPAEMLLDRQDKAHCAARPIQSACVHAGAALAHL